MAWGGQHRVLPSRLRAGSAVAIVLYLGFAALVSSRAGAIPGGESTAVTVGTWVLAGFLVISVVPNAISPSRAERLVQTPVCVALAIAVIVIAAHGP